MTSRRSLREDVEMSGERRGRPARDDDPTSLTRSYTYANVLDRPKFQPRLSKLDALPVYVRYIERSVRIDAFDPSETSCPSRSGRGQNCPLSRYQLAPILQTLRVPRVVDLRYQSLPHLTTL
jgi:hypothetical protein